MAAVFFQPNLLLQGLANVHQAGKMQPGHFCGHGDSSEGDTGWAGGEL